MDTIAFWALASSLLGLIVGSFLNVLILRHGTRSVTGRSSCMSCGRMLAWYELIPVISWILQRGKCRGCASKISIQYPLVELATGAVFALILSAYFSGGVIPEWSFSIAVLLSYFVMASLLMAIAVYDLQHMLIPDEWSYAFGGLALVTSLFAPLYDATTLGVILSGPIAALPLYALWAMSRGAWMGLGDPKLALGIGWLLGGFQGITAVLLAFIIGAVVAVCILIPLTRLRRVGEQITMKSEVPFGPFLIASTLLLWVLGMYGIEWSLFAWS